MKRVLHISILLSLLCSCEVDVSDQFRDQQNLFVVSGQVIAGEAPRINLSRTITMTELDTLMYLNEALLEIRKNDSLFVLHPEGDGFYKNEALIPEPGEVLRLMCSGEGLPEASIVTTVPEFPQVADIQFEVDEAYDFTLMVSIDDPASSMDHYTFYLSGWRREIAHENDPDTGEEWIDTSNYYVAYRVRITDPVLEYTGGPSRFMFYELDNPTGKYFHFRDQMFNGNRHTLNIKANLRHIYNDTIPEIYVHVIKKDAPYFSFIGSYIHYDPYPDQDFIQPVQVYSKIDGGFGLLTAESRVVDTIDMSQWYENPDFLDYINPPQQ